MQPMTLNDDLKGESMFQLQNGPGDLQWGVDSLVFHLLPYLALLPAAELFHSSTAQQVFCCFFLEAGSYYVTLAVLKLICKPGWP